MPPIGRFGKLCNIALAELSQILQVLARMFDDFCGSSHGMRNELARCVKRCNCSYTLYYSFRNFFQSAAIELERILFHAFVFPNAEIIWVPPQHEQEH